MNYIITNDKGIIGYKAFNEGLLNIHNVKFEIGKEYVVENKYKDYKFHFCKNIEDTLIYYRKNNIEICKVLGYGDITNYYNDYYGVYDIYASSKIKILHKLSREEIINLILNISSYSIDRIVRFISLFKLSNEEIELFNNNYNNCEDIIDAIKYYQCNDKKVYERKYNIKRY